MDLYLNREKINMVKNVLNTSVTQEETIEMIVPDALPDILRIVDVDATLLVRSKDTDAGRVSVSGVAATTIIYCPESGSGICRINVDIPFTVSAVEGEITPSSRVTARVSPISLDASIVNPRKFVARAEILAEIACYNDYELSICTDIDAPGDDIELLRDNLTVVTPVAVSEKSFVISDELTLPNSNPEIGEILKSRVSILAEEAKVVGNKVIFRGSTNISMLYSPHSGDEPMSAELTSEFSQIMDIDNMSEDGEFDIILMLTGAYFDKGIADSGDNRTISSELHVVAQCVAYEKRGVPFISDAYSTRFPLEQTLENLEISNRESITRPSSVFRGVLETPGTVSRVITIGVNTGTASVIDGVDNEITVGTTLNVTVVYIGDEGRVTSVSGRFQASAAADVRPGSAVTVSSSCGREIYGVATGNGIELRIAVDFTVTEASMLAISPIAELYYDEDVPVDISGMPSLMLSRASGGDTLWQLAKRHHSTQSLILAANELESESDVAVGQMLIIPKKR